MVFSFHLWCGLMWIVPQNSMVPIYLQCRNVERKRSLWIIPLHCSRHRCLILSFTLSFFFHLLQTGMMSASRVSSCKCVLNYIFFSMCTYKNRSQSHHKEAVLSTCDYLYHWWISRNILYNKKIICVKKSWMM